MSGGTALLIVYSREREEKREDMDKPTEAMSESKQLTKTSVPPVPMSFCVCAPKLPRTARCTKSGWMRCDGRFKEWQRRVREITEGVSSGAEAQSD